MGGKEYDDEEVEGRVRVNDGRVNDGRVRFKDEDEEEGHVCVCVKDADGSSTDGWGGGACVMHCTAALPAYCSNPLVFPNESCADRLSLSTIV